MSFLNQTASAAQKKNEIIQLSNGALSALMNSVRVAFDTIWNNPNFTAQEILNEFGTDAASLFAASQKSQELIKSLNPSWEILSAPNELVFNEDGTVTVGALKSEQPAEEGQGEPENPPAEEPAEESPSEDPSAMENEGELNA